MAYLLLIRHAETVDNVSRNYAGITDSALTAHGMTQAQRLAAHLPVQFRPLHIFTSDLSRALTTAQALRSRGPRLCTLTLAPELREQDFGSLEGVAVAARQSVPTVPAPESRVSMAMRADRFIETYLASAVRDAVRRGHGNADSRRAVVIISHGAFLRVLWDRIVAAYAGGQAQWAVPRPDSLSWRNTGVMTVRMVPPGVTAKEARTTWGLIVEGVNETPHLEGLRRTGGGLGSAAWEPGQKRMDDYFQKRTVVSRDLVRGRDREMPKI